MSPEPPLPITAHDVQLLRTTLDELRMTVHMLPDRIEQTYVRKDVYDLELAGLRRDVDEHSSWLEWAQRIVLAAVLLALLGTVLIQGGALP